MAVLSQLQAIRRQGADARDSRPSMYHRHALFAALGATADIADLPVNAYGISAKLNSTPGASQRPFIRPAARIVSAALVAALVLAQAAFAEADSELSVLGRALFFDVNLSAQRTQACATCHEPERAFSDGRDNRAGGAASLGGDGHSLGDRNTPAIGYAALVPNFQREADGEYRGGLFHDGRARNLAEQAAEPPLNPIEMAMPDAAAVIARVREQAYYVATFKKLFGARIFDDTQAAFVALTTAIAAFEQGPPFVMFDSRYDRYLAGEYTMSDEEELGRRLYFSDLTNCMNCHLLQVNTEQVHEPFTDFRYHNIGLPMNIALRASNDRGVDVRDLGLGAHPDVDDARAEGKFRTPTLRNIAVTAPYMHNGVFARLETALSFYNQYIVVNASAGINPETNERWGKPEVADNIALELLREGQPLDNERIAALVAFLRTLTDRRYEVLLAPSEPPGVAQDE